MNRYAKRHVRAVIFLCALVFSMTIIMWSTQQAGAVAVPAGPECGDIRADVVIMLDRTGSISTTERNAEASAAKSLLQSFIDTGATHSVAIGAFPASSSSHEATILTGGGLSTDYAALQTVIDTQFTAVTSLGTNIASAVNLAQSTLDGGSNSLKYMVILSDGQANRTIGQDPSTSRNSAAGIAAAQSEATAAKVAGTTILTIAYDATAGDTTTVAGRALLAQMASNASDDDTVGEVSTTEATQENADGDHFYIAPDTTTLTAIFASVGGTIQCDDGDACTIDTCESATSTCSYTAVDFDSDGVPDCTDSCPADPDKTEPGECGCDEEDTDSDGDGTADCNDECPSDANKLVPGTCGCGIADTDTDSDGAADCQDNCPSDPDKIAPGICGCGEEDVDADGDGSYDCDDACPASAIKTTPGVCGCDVEDTDSDGDGVEDCLDQCDDDASKTEPGQCGCGEVETDTDFDGTADCRDECPNDPVKTSPGVCGCGEADQDSDEDGTYNCNDQCPNDATKTAPGLCGCGVSDVDTDQDGVPTCQDECAENPRKALPGQCGCAADDTDSDGDETADCNDDCPNDASKIAAGICGCGVSDVDSDADGMADCLDGCPADVNKTSAGICGCGSDDIDSDEDGTFECDDNCPNDSSKTEPGDCGCSVADTDSDQDGIANCNDACPQDAVNDPDSDGICGISPTPDTTPTPETETETEAETETDTGVSVEDSGAEEIAEQVSVVTCDLSTDTDGDGRPDVLESDLTDNDADGIPDCCTNGNGSDALTGTDSDGDGLPDCREYALGTNPFLNDITFQGSATVFSFSNCSLTPTGTATEDDASLWLMTGLTGLLLVMVRLGRSQKMRRVLAGLTFVVGMSGLMASPAHAFDVQAQRGPDGTGKGFRLSTSSTLPQGEISLGAHFNYVHHPLELGGINNDPRLRGVVDRFVTTNLVTTIGLHDRLNITADMPFNIYHNIAPTLIPTRDTGWGDVGDLKISAKVKFLDAEKSKGGWGLALVPFLSAPTGDSSIFFGESGITGGGVGVVDKKFGERHRLFLNMGAKFRKRETLGNLVIDHQYLYGVGYQLTASKKHDIDLTFEAQGTTTIDKFYNDEITTPIETHAVVQKKWGKKRKLLTYAGAGMGITNGYSSPDFRVSSGLAWSFNVKKEKKPVKPQIISETVYFPFDKAKFYPVHWQQITKVADYYTAHPGTHIAIVGHTDAKGSNSYNEKLSMRRAAQVKKALVSKGVPAENITLEYRGEEAPADSNDTDAGRQHNRRVTIEIMVTGSS